MKISFFFSELLTTKQRHVGETSHQTATCEGLIADGMGVKLFYLISNPNMTFKICGAK